MPTETTSSAAFKPRLVGVSPAGVSWVARRPGDAAIMRRRLETFWARAAATQAADLIGPMVSLLAAVSGTDADLCGRGAQLRGLRLRGLIVRHPLGQWRITKLGRMTLQVRSA